MIGPQRLSLLDGDVLRREYSARDAIDRVLDRLVDAFDFPIASAATTPSTAIHKSSTDEKPPSSLPKSIGEAYALFKECKPQKPQSQRQPVWSFLSATHKTQSLSSLLNERLCQWILNATPDGEKKNPMELGWSSHCAFSSSSASKNVAELSEEELLFYADDRDCEELPLECNYTCMTC